MENLLTFLPELPISFEAAVVISALTIALALAIGVLITNRRVLKDSSESEDDLGTIFENPASILPHVLELRSRLIKSFIAIGVGTLISAVMTQQLMALLTAPLSTVGGQQTLIAIGVTEPFAVLFRVAVVAGIILASPYVIAQLWVFTAAGLKTRERRIFYLFVPFAVVLFITGVVFAYIAMLPVAIPFLINFAGFQATPTLENYIKFVTSVLLAIGASFEMPLVMFALAKAGIVNAKMLVKNWRIALVGIAILAAVVTPTPDPVNMGIVAAPLIVLYLLSIFLALFA